MTRKSRKVTRSGDFKSFFQVEYNLFRLLGRQQRAGEKAYVMGIEARRLVKLYDS